MSDNGGTVVVDVKPSRSNTAHTRARIVAGHLAVRPVIARCSELRDVPANLASSIVVPGQARTISASVIGQGAASGDVTPLPAPIHRGS